MVLYMEFVLESVTSKTYKYDGRKIRYHFWVVTGAY